MSRPKRRVIEARLDLIKVWAVSSDQEADEIVKMLVEYFETHSGPIENRSLGGMGLPPALTRKEGRLR